MRSARPLIVVLAAASSCGDSSSDSGRWDGTAASNAEIMLLPQGEDPSATGSVALDPISDPSGTQTGDDGALQETAGSSAATGGASSGAAGASNQASGGVFNAGAAPAIAGASTTDAASGSDGAADAAGSPGGEDTGHPGVSDPCGDADAALSLMSGSWSGEAASGTALLSGMTPGLRASMTLGAPKDRAWTPDCQALSGAAEFYFTQSNFQLTATLPRLWANASVASSESLLAFSGASARPPAPETEVPVVAGDAACVAEYAAGRSDPPPVGDSTVALGAALSPYRGCNELSAPPTPSASPPSDGLYLHVSTSNTASAATVGLSWQRFACGRWQPSELYTCFDLTRED